MKAHTHLMTLVFCSFSLFGCSVWMLTARASETTFITPIPQQVDVDKDKAELGKKLFFDKRDDVSEFSPMVGQRATECGRLQILKWLEASGHPWNKRECYEWAKRDRLSYRDILRWMKTNFAF